ncbi:GPI anchored CFEM domain containing protein [Pyrenophora tritici-repentis]|uniref:GPI anchored CFEM domain containing protein n=2 Tax=Pyrenophora tritici-repentis TaxID=45151 RepID=A0A922T158_9PLEO|nr:GPI anchored CFEM domain containing protein [Pyrenophora tritici-repentis Pt-1C-BFP]EDU40367.1 GPI anchored CFEM domain containing protein [Pyrenophora tritici-repentis Pt-1C-BFP]KAI1520829.1 GPI anchored CFEM domain containing protein [Pyrenophora tritici-repentis]KAI1674821.1 GPI anchored CFEM domain containing protein [Pyrenophora tritici-repentis]KAI1688052.1 GPI anchored CFEM domain containing protein [Pyrenophora tritici-repentis]
MKSFTIASIIALASVASAQLDNIPSCALNCFIGPLTSDGCSALTDFKCHCQKGGQLLSQVQPCVEKACNPSDQAAAISAVESTCKAAGVPITIPNASGAASAASSAAATVTSAVASAASSAASAASSQASAASSVLSVVSSAVASAASSASASASMSSQSTASHSASASASASASQFTGGAPQATQAAGILGAAALAMLVL